jgi:Ca-activated chloride channel homolog
MFQWFRGLAFEERSIEKQTPYKRRSAMKSPNKWIRRPWKVFLTETIAEAIVICLLGFVLSTAWAAVTEGAAAVTCSIETDKSALQANETQKVVAKVTLKAALPTDARDRSPVNLAVVLDRSGSMRGEKIEKAKEAAVEALKRLTPQDVFSLVIYDHIVETLIPAQHVKDIDAIASKIKSIEARGSTALFGGVSEGAREVRKHIEDKFVHRVILLSDGLANVGPSSPDELGRLGAALLKEGISVTTVGVGMDYNEDLMTKLSQNSDGNSYFVESGKDLPKIFAAELGDVLSVRAKRVTIVVECPDGVKPTSIIGREGRIIGRKAEISLNQLYGGQEKYALLELEVPAQAPKAALELAQVKVRFDDPIVGKPETVETVARVRFSADKSEVEKSVNASVATAYASTLNALTQERAILMADKGNVKEAAEELKKSASKLRSIGLRYSDPSLVKQADEQAAGAKDIEKRGWGTKSRKELRTDSYQNMNQQKSR